MFISPEGYSIIMKRLFLISTLSLSFFALALTQASAADLAIYSGPTNPGWISQEAALANAEAIMNDARIQAIFENIDNYGDGDEFGYDSPLGRWMQAHTNNGQQDVFIAASGTAPSAIYQFPNVHPDGSNIEKFIEAGNVFINVADYLLYMSYEGGRRSVDNTGTGAANVFDIPGLSFWRNGFSVPTDAGRKYIPSLEAFHSHRSWPLNEFVGTDWEVTPFAVSSTDPNTADPAVAVNKTYGGIIAAMWQTEQPHWRGNDPRASGVIEFIANWLTEHGRITSPGNTGDNITTNWEQQKPDSGGAGGSVTVSVSPSRVQSPVPGEQLVLNMNITGGENVAGYQLTLHFDTTALRYVSSSNAGYLPAGAFAVPPKVGGNQVTLAATSLNGGSQGDGTLATVTFEVLAVKRSALTLSEVKLTNVDADFLSVSAENGEVVESTLLDRDNVRLVYFRPNDRPRRPDIDTQLDTLIREVQYFYATQMQRYQGKTFTFETDADGYAVVHHVDGAFNDAHYHTHTYNRVRGEIAKKFDISKQIYLVAVDVSNEVVHDGNQGGVCGIGGGNWLSRDSVTWHRDAGGFAVIPASGDCFNMPVTAHELGHTFGLEHDFRDDTYLMAYGTQSKLSESATEWLSRHPCFNSHQTESTQETALALLSSRVSALRFQITDADGLHQAQLLIPTAPNDAAPGTKLHSHQALKGDTNTTAEFSATELAGTSGQEVTLQVIDMEGNITKRAFRVETDSIAAEPETPIAELEDVVTVSLSPDSVWSGAIGDQLTLNVNIAAGVDVAGYQVSIDFDRATLRYISSANADYLPPGAFIVPVLASGNRVTLAATSLQGSSEGDGTLATFTFEVVAVSPRLPTLSDAKLTDSNADFLDVRIENATEMEPTQLAGDVNGDGVVDLTDMETATARLGQTGENTADMNGDGVVNAADLLLIAAAIGQGNAAPALHAEHVAELFAATEVRAWLSLARAQGLTGPMYQRGIQFLEQLLAVLTPEATALLPNYPNPFNPETWIPYHLSEDADVTIAIYATDGRLVRTLALGHQTASVYATRSHAVYCDGKNEVGEPVASGVYFYTLTAGDFAATRKMLIRK